MALELLTATPGRQEAEGVSPFSHFFLQKVGLVRPTRGDSQAILDGPEEPS